MKGNKKNIKKKYSSKERWREKRKYRGRENN